MASESKWYSDGVWTTDEIIENANKWSLAGDVALLNTIKLFSKNMLRKTEELSQNVDNLLVHVDEVSLKLDISQNQFHSLKNTQFIENRVYEDDETLDSKEEGKVVEKPPSEEDQEKMISESVILGLEILNQYYEMVEVSISDTEEDEETERSFILKPKDTYAHRPLPPVIGTDEWYKRWNSENSSSDSDDNKMADIYSESDSDDNLPKDLFKGSETSSELDFSSHTNENRLVAHSTFNDSTRRPELVTSCEDSQEQEHSTVNASISSKLFAEQLAAKLDSVISTEEDLTGQINKEPIQPVKSNTFCGNLFSDEPPPLSEPGDRTFPKSASVGLFSGGERLFDDVVSIHDNDQNKIPFNTTGNDDHKSENFGQKFDKNTSFLPKSSKVSKGLFDSDDSSDDDIFSTSKTKFDKLPFLKPSKPFVPLFDNEPPKLKDEYEPTEEITKKKPTGGVSIFGNSNIFGNEEIKSVLKNQQQNITHDLFKEEVNSTSEPASVITQQVSEDKRQPRRKQFSLFDDDTEDNFSQESKKEPLKKNILFDDEYSDVENKVLIKEEYSDKKSLKSEDKSQDIKIYDNVGKEKKPVKNVSLFDDKSNILAKNKTNISLFDDDDELFKDDLFSELTSKKFKSNLFDDLENSNDLFSEKIGSVDNTLRRDNLKDKNEVISNDTVSVSDNENRSHSSSMDVEGDPKFVNIIKDDSVNNNGLHVNTEQKSFKGEFMVPDVDKAQTNDKHSKFFEDVGKSFFDTEPDQQSSGLEENIVSHLSPKKETTPKYDSEQKEDKIIVRLFDSTPPPDDEDGEWDTKSDNFSDSDDYTSYRADEDLQRSSLFDDEPPSLGPNDSSGIVRDHSTRVYTDDSSFYPYASSSRRLSSDIFSEQQYHDSLFVTKSEEDMVTVSSNMDIQEDSNINRVNIIPSDNVQGMEPTDNKILDSENNLLAFDESSIKNESKSAKDEEYNEISSNESEDHDVKNIFINQNNNDHENNVLQSPVESEIKGSRQNFAIASITDMLKNEKESKNSNIKVPPGKLKHSMNINVNALVPGYSPQKSRELSKSQSLDSAKSEDYTFLKAEIVETSSMPAVRKTLPGTTLEKAVSFDDVDNVEVLPSVTKDRAKLPLNRRPSTRKGRQAAMKNSVIDNDSMLSDKQEKKEVEDVPNRMDIRAQKTEEDERPAQEKKTQCYFSETSKDLIVSIEKGQVIKQYSSKESTTNKIKGLFDSGSESDNDLFSSSQAKSKKMKKLFDDESSDEDLFSTAGSSGTTRRKESMFKSSNKTSHKTVSVKKLENIQTSEDPLSNLF